MRTHTLIVSFYMLFAGSCATASGVHPTDTNLYSTSLPAVSGLHAPSLSHLPAHASELRSKNARKRVVFEGTGVLIAPKPIDGKTPGPFYPQVARLAGIEGVTVIRATIDIEGTPVEIRVDESSGSTQLDNAATEAAQKWRFTPATWLGQPVEQDVLIPFRFELVTQQKVGR